MSLAVAAFALAPGLAIGSFLNVVVARVPLRRSIVSPPSACMSCGHELAWYDNVPLVSWLVLRRTLPLVQRPDRGALSRGRARDRTARRRLLLEIRRHRLGVRRRLLLHRARRRLRDGRRAPRHSRTGSSSRPPSSSLLPTRRFT